ncbi:MAG: response regulator [Alphaproteobacteria bacterium]
MSESATHILFVDDDPLILQATRRQLRGRRVAWAADFAESGDSALLMMRDRPFDVVVTDMHMPGMDGATLLAQVKNRYPATVRIILSGYSDEETVLRTVGPAHQYVAKPCDPDALFNTIERAIVLRKLLANEPLRRLVAGLGNLPTPPTVYTQLVEELKSNTASPASVAKIISQDVAMTAQILKLTNTSFFSVSFHVSSVLQAVRLLGFETVQSLVLKLGVFRQLKGGKRIEGVLDRINKQSLLIGSVARDIALSENLGSNVADLAFCAGMLSQIGSVVLIDWDADRFLSVIGKCPFDNGAADHAAKAVGACHTQLGGYLLGLWGFSDPVVEAVTCQLRPEYCAGDGLSVLAVLHAAQALAAPMFSGVPLFAPLNLDYLSRLGYADQVEHWKKIAETRSGEVDRDGGAP